MSLDSLKCPDCGAILEKNENDEYICPYCGSKFEKNQDVNITNEISIHKGDVIHNYYGEAAKSQINKNKIDDYFELILNNMGIHDFSSAGKYTERILNLEPSNKDALNIKPLLNRQKENGRFNNQQFVKKLHPSELNDYLLPIENMKSVDDCFYYVLALKKYYYNLIITPIVIFIIQAPNVNVHLMKQVQIKCFKLFSIHVLK